MKEIKIFLSIFLVGVFFTGCSIQKRCQAPELNLPDEIIAGENDTLTIADMAWWELYSDTTLTNLINKTLNNNRNMRAAEAHIKQMEELYRVSKASLFPTINGLVSGNRETNAYYGEKTSIDPEFSLKASLSWEADLWGSLRWSKRKGAAEYLASVEAARAMQMTLIAETATAYFELVALDQELEIVLQTVQTREESVNQARLRFEGGLTSETAYQQAQVELANASALIPNLEQQIAMKENQIAVLSGEYPSKVERGKFDFNISLPEEMPIGLPSTLLQRRPDVRQAEQQLRSAMASVGIAYADRFPRLTISLVGGLENDELKGFFESPFSYVAGNFVAPLITFGKKKAQYKAALAAYDEKRFAYEQKVLEVFREVNDAVITYQKKRRTSELQLNLFEAAQKYVDLAQLQYLNGVIRYIDVLDAHRNFFDAQIGLSNAIRADIRAMAILYKVWGGGGGSQAACPPPPPARRSPGVFTRRGFSCFWNS